MPVGNFAVVCQCPQQLNVGSYKSITDSLDTCFATVETSFTKWPHIHKPRGNIMILFSRIFIIVPHKYFCLPISLKVTTDKMSQRC